MFKSLSFLADQLFPLFFGGAVAIVLLLLYASTMFYMVYAVMCSANLTCPNSVVITDGMVFVLTTVGGLVSALVVSHLAAAKPGEHPINRFVPPDSSEGFKLAANVIGTLYLAVWMVVGLAALVVGVMLYPAANKTLSDAGSTWLGLAVAAGYSYFGIQPHD